MLRLQVKPRELVLILVLAALSLGVGWYYLLFTPLNETRLNLEGQLAQTEQQLLERREMQLHDAETQEQLQLLQAEQLALQARFDPISSAKDLIDYLVALTGQNSWTNSLEIKPEQVTITILSQSYKSAKIIIDSLEASPNFVPTILELMPSDDEQGTYTLKIQAKLTWGQAPAGEAEKYQRTIPFGGEW